MAVKFSSKKKKKHLINNNLIVQRAPQAEQEKENNITPRQNKFIEDYSLARELIKDIEPSLASSDPNKLLFQLMSNFEKINFTYTRSKSPPGEDLLKGNRTGDCQTLATAFQLVAEGYFGVKGIELRNVKDNFLINQTIEAPYAEGKPNCDQGKKWFFDNHHWAEYQGTVYDVLFQSNQLLDQDKTKGGVRKSMFMPYGEYWETDKGTIVYYTSDYKYSTVPLSVYEKLSNMSNYLSESFVNQIKALFLKNDLSNLDNLMQEASHLRDKT